MTDAEKESCAVLLKEEEAADEGQKESTGNSSAASNSFAAQLEARKNKWKAISKEESKYINCDFILGSAAEVERLWSEADAIITKQRASTSPLLVEVILNLNYNRRLWGLNDVVDANKMRLEAGKESREQKRIQALEEYEQLVQETNYNLYNVYSINYSNNYKLF